MQRFTQAPLIDHSLAYMVGAFSAVCFGLAVFAFSHTGAESILSFADEVKVEAAQFPFPPPHEIDIFAAGCNGKLAKIPCKSH